MDSGMHSICVESEKEVSIEEKVGDSKKSGQDNLADDSRTRPWYLFESATFHGLQSTSSS
jgi:hypothetical protein